MPHPAGQQKHSATSSYPIGQEHGKSGGIYGGCAELVGSGGGNVGLGETEGVTLIVGVGVGSGPAHSCTGSVH